MRWPRRRSTRRSRRCREPRRARRVARDDRPAARPRRAPASRCGRAGARSRRAGARRARARHEPRGPDRRCPRRAVAGGRGAARDAAPAARAAGAGGVRRRGARVLVAPHRGGPPRAHPEAGDGAAGRDRLPPRAGRARGPGLRHGQRRRRGRARRRAAARAGVGQRPLARCPRRGRSQRRRARAAGAARRWRSVGALRARRLRPRGGESALLCRGRAGAAPGRGARLRAASRACRGAGGIRRPARARGRRYAGPDTRRLAAARGGRRTGERGKEFLRGEQALSGLRGRERSRRHPAGRGGAAEEERDVDSIVIRGGIQLAGEVEVSGAKNAALPLLFATLLTPERCTLRHVPALADIRTTLAVLTHLGADVADSPDGHEVRVEARSLTRTEAPYELVKTMRASFLALGPLLARFGRARVSLPGGCAIGARPVDLHLAGLVKMGARLAVREGYVEAEAERLRGANIVLDFPSVGATQQLMMAAALAEGTTVIENAAREPENECLAMLLERMGVWVEGAGTSRVTVEGRRELHGADMRVISDRLEAGSFMVAAAITGGCVRVAGARYDHLEAFVTKLRETGVVVTEVDGGMRVEANGRLTATDVRTMPYPGFPTDLQAQMMALMTRAAGTSTFTETIFENRMLHAVELARMGAQIRVDANTAMVRGPTELSGAPVMATDLRASVSLVLAGLAASGETRVARVYHLDRGYESLEAKLGALGADVARVKDGA